MTYYFAIINSMSNDYILSLAQQVDQRAEPNVIAELTGGFSSQAYKIDIPGNSFVLLIERETAVSQ
jgi:hypothetical protein